MDDLKNMTDNRLKAAWVHHDKKMAVIVGNSRNITRGDADYRVALWAEFDRRGIDIPEWKW